MYIMLPITCKGGFINSQNSLLLFIVLTWCPAQSRCACLCALSLSRVQLFETPWTVARQPPLSMRFPRQEYWSGLPFRPGDLPDRGIEPTSPSLAGIFFITEPPGRLSNNDLANGLTILLLSLHSWSILTPCRYAVCPDWAKFWAQQGHLLHMIELIGGVWLVGTKAYGHDLFGYSKVEIS